MDTPAQRTLLGVARGGLLVVPLLALVNAGWPDWLTWLLPDLYFPSVTARNLVFRGLVQVLLLCWAVLALLQPRYRPRQSPALVVIGLLVAAVTLADLAGPHPRLSIWGSYERMEGLIGLLHMGAFYLIARSVLDTRTWWKRLATTSMVISMVVALIAIAQAADMHYGITEPFGLVDAQKRHITTNAFRANICLGNAVFLSGYLMFHLFVAALVASASRGPKRAAILAAAAVLILPAMVLTKTRAAYVGLVCGAAAWAWVGGQTHRRLHRTMTMAAAGLLLLVALSLLSVGWIDDLIGTDRIRHVLASLGVRAELWLQAFTALADRPWGLGQEGFALASDGRHGVAAIGADSSFDRPHNVFVRGVVDGGVVGGVALLGLFGLALRALCANVWPGARAERALLAGALVAYATFHCSQPDDLTSQLGLFALLAYLDAMRPQTAPTRQPATAWHARGLAAVAVSAGILAFVLVTVPGWRAAGALLDVVHLRQQVEQSSHAGDAMPAITADRALIAAQRALKLHAGARPEARREVAHLARAISVDAATPAATRDALLDLARGELADALAKQRVVGVNTLELAADLELTAGDFAAADRLYRRAADLAPRKRLVVVGLAKAAWGLRQLDRAVDLMATLHRREPQHRDVQSLLLVLALEAGRLDVVEEVATVLGHAHILPDDSVLEMYRRAGRIDLLRPTYEIIADWGESIWRSGSLDAVNVGLAGFHARAALALDRRDQARAFLDRFLELWPPGPRRRPSAALVTALREAGRWDWIARVFEPIVDACDRAVRRGRLSPSQAWPHTAELATAYAELGNHDRAVAIVRQAIQLHPAFAQRGEALIAQLRAR